MSLEISLSNLGENKLNYWKAVWMKIRQGNIIWSKDKTHQNQNTAIYLDLGWFFMKLYRQFKTSDLYEKNFCKKTVSHMARMNQEISVFAALPKNIILENQQFC